MKLTDDGYELPSAESNNLMRMFGIAVDGVSLFYGDEHPETVEARETLAIVKASRQKRKEYGHERVVFPAEQLPKMAKLADFALRATYDGIVDDFCATNDYVTNPALRAPAYRTLALAAEITEQVRIDEAFNELTLNGEN